MVHMSAWQIPTAEALVGAPEGQSIDTATLILLWTCCKRPMMGEVECSIRLYEV